MTKKQIITYALPYANGSLHLGHMMGMVQADCYARAKRLLHNEVLFVCGDDAHGTPIMLNAQKQEVQPEELVEKIYQEHVADIKAFNISFDGYHSTHSDLNTRVVHAAYNHLDSSGCIITKSINQAYDEEKGMFLPDRFIKGQCPLCQAEDQYGDHCESCGKTYAIEDLINPSSIVSNTEPVWKPSEHDFFTLSQKKEVVENWLKTAELQTSIINKLSEWFDDELKDWDISRDEPYFGIGIPGKPGKYFYVWLDAPFGYLSSMGDTLGLASVEEVFEAWNAADVEHFIGKDIVYFHGVFWPAVLESVGLKLPKRMHVHGFLKLSGTKMSKSRGSFIALNDYLSVLPADMMRYYLASRLGEGIVDVDIKWTDFSQKINSDLVGKLINIGSRCQGFVHKHHEGKLGKEVDMDFWSTLEPVKEQVQQAYLATNLALVCRLVMEACDHTNQYIDHHKPWVLAKEGKIETMQTVVTTGLNAFRYLTYLLAPILPDLALKVAEAFGDSDPTWDIELKTDQTIAQYGHLLGRVTDDDVQKLTG